MSKYSKLNEWVVACPINTSADYRLLFFPFAGGTMSYVLNWNPYINPDIELLCLTLPGRGTRLGESSITEWNELIPAIVDHIFDLTQQKPYAMFGYSLGSRVAYEVSSAIIKRGGTPPIHLYAAASASPTSKYKHNFNQGCMRDISDEGLKQILRKLGGTPPEILDHDELMQLFLPFIRADFILSEEYTLNDDHAILPCPITYFGGELDRISASSQESWNELTSCGYTSKMFEGGHFFINEQLETVLTIIQESIQSSHH
eukprot:TRINITY_DN1584_c0_g1_i1.p1 TRINITY_DN1584_c0_g1~~TRINITY_DN1584_c0_g1_i1.p1  ORF type:complete len:259 (-),score=47.76 TRINITY_DN1584_c0_g1_i1:8-784(-)